MFAFRMVKTTLGCFGYVARNEKLIAAYLPTEEGAIRRAIQRAFPTAVEDAALLPRFARQVVDYFAGRVVSFDVPVDLSAVTPFRRRVLMACRRVPYGKTVSYADLARRAGSPGAARAVGSAMAHNPIPLVIPCHRVLASGGGLGGFSASRGVALKEQMLELEGTLAPAW